MAETPGSPFTRGCRRRDAAKPLAHMAKPLNRLTLGISELCGITGTGCLSSHFVLALQGTLAGFDPPIRPAAPAAQLAIKQIFRTLFCFVAATLRFHLIRFTRNLSNL
ncbi:MAG TPA: hypothetical protein VK752_13615 [Bryobacteraceae bacterium]|nr:hypothetical protein [Bryobacteraceae bacterium]